MRTLSLRGRGYWEVEGALLFDFLTTAAVWWVQGHLPIARVAFLVGDLPGFGYGRGTFSTPETIVPGDRF